MNYHTICRELMNLGFDGDIQSSSDQLKDMAVKLYLEQFEPHELYEYFPAEMQHPRYLLEMLYTDEWQLWSAWTAQAHASEMVLQGDYDDDMCWWSEALDGQDRKLRASKGDGLEFCRIITEAFYLYAEPALKDELLTAYTEITASDIYDASIALAENKWREAV